MSQKNWTKLKEDDMKKLESSADHCRLVLLLRHLLDFLSTGVTGNNHTVGSYRLDEDSPVPDEALPPDSMQ